MNKILNNTSVDEKALYLNLFREQEEDIDSFTDRVNEAFENAFELNSESFFKSLDYLTSIRSIPIIEVTPKDAYKLYTLHFDGVFLKCFNEEKTEINSIEIYKEEKFIQDFFNKCQLELGIYFTFTLVEDSFERKYLLSENIVPFNNLKHRHNFLTQRSSSNTLNDKNVIELADYNNVLNEGQQTNLNSLIVNDAKNSINSDSSQYYAKDGLFLKSTADSENVFYNYAQWPLIIEWNECKAFEFNSESFDYRIKNKVKINKDDVSTKPYLLHQKGAKLINQLLKLDNTYWGK